MASVHSPQQEPRKSNGSSSNHSGMYTHHEEPQDHATQQQQPPPLDLPDYQSTPDGDVAVVIDTPFNDGDYPPSKGRSKRRGRRSRNLSDLFLDATTLSDSKETLMDYHGSHEEEEKAATRYTTTTTRNSHPQEPTVLFQQLTNDELDNNKADDDRKHRRLFSDESGGGGSHPPVAHRRLDSVGNVERKVRLSGKRVVPQQQPQDNDEQPQGLDLLSATAAATAKGKQQQQQQDQGSSSGGAAAAAVRTRPSSIGVRAVTTGSYTRPSLGVVSNGSFDQQHHHHQQLSPLSSAAAAPTMLVSARSTSTGGAVNYQGFAVAPPPVLLYPQGCSGYHYPAGGAMMGPPPPVQYPMQQQAMYPPLSSSSSTYDYLRHAAVAAGDSVHHQQQQQPNVHFWDPQQQQHPQYTIHKGSQTFVTGLAVGDGTKVLHPAKTYSSATKAAAHHRKLSSFSTALNGMLGPADDEEDDDTEDVGTNTTGTSLGLFRSADHQQRHHRKMSSTISFLQGLGNNNADAQTDGPDDAFLRNLQATNAELQEAYRESQEQMYVNDDKDRRVTAQPEASVVVTESPRRSTPSPPAAVVSTTAAAMQHGPYGMPYAVPAADVVASKAMPNKAVSARPTAGLSYAAVASADPTRAQYCGVIDKGGNTSVAEYSLDGSEELTDGEANGTSGSKLAAGGTSKRVRRKCTMGNCDNRVVQGGLCIAHGAKRKQCKHPGCDKNVKKAGLCSAHGPARKRCSVGGCEKVAVQGGRCIGHGARKKLCGVDDCSKQAIINGMCKRHHDLQQSSTFVQGPSQVPSHSSTSNGGAAVPGHQRGLSIFQEMSADAVSTLLNEEAQHYQ